MGQSPPGDTYNETGEGLPLLNGPTEFGTTSPECTRFTTDSRRECEPGDLIFCVRGSTTGRMNWADRKYSLGRGVCGFRGATHLETRFIRYCIENRLHALLQLAGGGTFPNLTKDDIAEFEIPWPENRARIAGILSAYDELIENSQRRIRILEAMARALYREWFVHFRFPGHEKLPRVASPLGDIPEGWEVKTIADVCESVTYGYTASASREEVGPKFLRITDIVPATIDWAGVPFCEISEATAPKYLLKHGDIVVARTGATTGYAKRLNKLHPDTVFASYLVRARAKVGVSNRMLGVLMESDEYKQFIQTNIGGAAQPQANAVVLTSMQLAVPPSSVCEAFDRLVEPMMDEAELLAVRIQNLRRTGDLLLPRLLSGQVELKEN
jgi:type I restriction enzyme S subunit